MMALFAVALVLSDEIAAELELLRGKYSKRMNFIRIPHVTLTYPFAAEADISLIDEKLRHVAGQTKSFTVLLDGIEYFEGENNVAYIALANKQPVIDLHYDINQSIDELIKDEFRGRFNRGNFIPHLTIGEQIPGDIFPEVKQNLSGENIRYECEITSFELFSSEVEGVWNKAEVFGFPG